MERGSANSLLRKTPSPLTGEGWGRGVNGYIPSMNTLKVFSEKTQAYYLYQARQNYLRQQRSIQNQMEALRTDAERERAEKEAALADKEAALADKEAAWADKEAAWAEIERLKALLRPE